jgi:hypothetical protein
MLVNFNSLTDSSRVWIYQSSKEFSNSEVSSLKEKLDQFITDWNSHGKDLKASYQIKYSRFIILAVDENYNAASGCSIDASVHLIKQFENDFSTDLMNKLNITFKDHQNINMVNLSDFQKFVKEGKITPATVVFNNMVRTKAEFDKNWEVLATDSWHKRFFPN